MPAGQLGESPACTMRATKTGIRRSRASVSAFGSWASGAETAGVAIPSKCMGLPEAVELRRPEGGPGEVRPARSVSGQPPCALVGEVAAPRLGRLDLRPFPPLVEARDAHDVRMRGERRAPERVIGGSVPPRSADRELACTSAVVAGTDARRADEALRVSLRAQPRELCAGVREEVVGVDAVEAAGHCEPDLLRPGE